jgi:hypothetical protein
MIRLWRREWFERTPPIEEVDFGNGHRVSAADVLDGHFHQLAAHSGNTQQNSTLPVALHTAQDRQAMIEVVAPTLTPLIDLAEAVAQRMPEAQPTAHFRHTLNKALTETHRQHSAQQTLGIRQFQAEEPGWHKFVVVSLILMVITVGVAWHGQRVRRTTGV